MDSMPPLEGMAGGHVSGELSAILRAIADITIDHGPKFSPKIHRQLVRAIVCRNYASPLHELCHLFVIAERTFGTQGFERLMWESGEATATSFRNRFVERGASAQVALTDNGVTALYPEGRFSIAYSRMPFLSALTEFLLSSLGYGDMDAVLRAVPATQLRNYQVKNLANDLARRVYAYLTVHLPTAQSQRKFRAVLAFLRQSAGDTPRADHIDDEAVLAFWICASANERIEGDFRSFRSVFRLMAAVRDALEAESRGRAIAYAKPMGADVAGGEIDPARVDAELVETAFAPDHEHRAPLDTLESPPASEVKFFKRTEMAVLAPILEAGNTANALPLSVLRAQVMGDLQARMVQALRRADSPREVVRLCDLEESDHTYATHTARLDQIRESLEQVLLASLHRLLRARNGEAVNILLALRPDMDLTPLAGLLEEQTAPEECVVYLHPSGSSDRLWQVLTENRADCPDLSGLLKASEAAARRITRKGFRNTTEDSDTDAFAEASGALIAIRATLSRFADCLDQLARQLGGWEARYTADARIFKSQFQIFYGDR